MSAVVYRLLDEACGAVYVGSTGHLEARLTAHARQPWWPEVATIELTGHPTREHANIEERRLISELRPRRNAALPSSQVRQVARSSPRIDLIQSRTGEDLFDYLTRCRTEGVSWREITWRLREKTGVDISDQTLTTWYRSRVEAAS